MGKDLKNSDSTAVDKLNTDDFQKCIETYVQAKTAINSVIIEHKHIKPIEATAHWEEIKARFKEGWL
jgi:hypothetical protein